MVDDGAADDGSAPSRWRFLIDENLDPNIATKLAHRGIEAEHVLGALFEGADDFEDILPYCRATGTILVTNNMRDFNAADIDPAEHPGVVVVHDKARPAEEIATELERIVATYPDRESFRGFESADDWTT